jgi:hypothetical protein
MTDEQFRLIMDRMDALEKKIDATYEMAKPGWLKEQEQRHRDRDILYPKAREQGQ